MITIDKRTCKGLVFYFLTIFFIGLLLPAYSQNTGTSPAVYAKRKLLLRDEGLSQLSFIDLAKPDKNWYLPVPAGRDLQLVGKGRVLIGTGNGYEEREISTGKKVYEVNTFTNTVAARRLRNGNTLLAGLNWDGKQGIVLKELDASGAIKRQIIYPGFTYARLVRETIKGTFLITADDTVFEGDDKGNVIWKAQLTGYKSPHAWQALRLLNGNTIVSGGYTKDFQIFAPDGKPVKSVTGPAEVHPNFYAGFQILSNGNIVVTNWQGHGAKYGASGVQLLEYNTDRKLVWSWKQDPEKFSSLQGVIVLDDLNLNMLHVEDANGALTPIRTAR